MKDGLFSSASIDLLSTKKKVVVGLSGGVDSVVVLHELIRIRDTLIPSLSIRAIHVNHGLSEHSHQWQDFCVFSCLSLDIPIITHKVVIEGGGNLEAKARSARYGVILSDLCEGESLVTGHHLDDQVETVLLALKRGTGLDGLCAMAVDSVVSGINIFRPLLDVSQSAIQEYAEVRDLKWVEDESNADIRFDRNFLRHNVIPLLEERWPSFKSSVGRAATTLQSSRLVTESLMSEQVDSIINQGFVSVKGISNLSKPHCIVLIREWIKRLEIQVPSFAQLNEIYKAVLNSRTYSRPVFQLSKKHNMVRIGDRVMIKLLTV